MKAFPTEHPIAGTMSHHADGMDLRDYFAAKAMRFTYEFWIKDYFEMELNKEETKDGLMDCMGIIAETAYEMADAMMKAREQ
jgi:hypothetical protein